MDNRISDELRERVIANYIATPEGRTKLAQSFAHPNQLRIEFYKEWLANPLVAPAPEEPVSLNEQILLGERILSACQLDELKTAAIDQMALIVQELREVNARAMAFVP